MHFIQSILPSIAHFHIIGYWIAFLAVLLETIIGIGLIIPGSTIVLFMGALSAGGVLDLGDLLWFAIAGAIIGDNINYFIGKKYGSKIFKKGFWFIKPEHFKKGEKFFEKHGSKSIFISRFVPSLKEVIPLIAGTFKMKQLPFIIWNTLGAIGWSLVWILPGYFFAQSLNLTKIWLTRAGFFLVFLTILFILFYLLKLFLVRKGKNLFLFLLSIYQSLKQALIKNSEIKKFTDEHKKLFSFLQKRLDKKTFYGLPLTLSLLILIYVLSLFGGIVEDVINSDIIVQADVRVANLLAVFRNTGLTQIFFWITFLGKWQIILIFTIATISIMWLWQKRTYIMPLLLSIIGSEIFTFIGKIAFHRARPATAIYPENTFSFPSGHSTIAVAFYGFLAYFLIKNSRQWKYKVNIFFASTILILLIGFSRLYLGVHYLSDVWGGYLAGFIWLIIAISLSEYLLFKKPAENIPHHHKKTLFLTIGIILVSLGAYIFFSLHYQIPTHSQIKTNQKIIIQNPINIFNPEELKYTETLLGDKQEPLNFIIITKNNQSLINLFKNAGWSLSDKVNIHNLYKAGKTALLKKSYAQAPITPDFWDAQVNNFGFEKETASDNIRTRHHARFWKTNYITKDGENIYVGTASFDAGIKWGITHKINPDIDTEREFLFKDLQKTNDLIKSEKKQFVQPELGNNFTGDPFFTDGKLYILFVK